MVWIFGLTNFDDFNIPSVHGKMTEPSEAVSVEMIAWGVSVSSRYQIVTSNLNKLFPFQLKLDKKPSCSISLRQGRERDKVTGTIGPPAEICTRYLHRAPTLGSAAASLRRIP